MKKRIEIHLSNEESEILTLISKRNFTNRKNFVESMVRSLIKKESKNISPISQ